MRYTTANQIDDAIRKHFAKQGCVVLSEVRNGTGFRKAPRTADALTPVLLLMGDQTLSKVGGTGEKA